MSSLFDYCPHPHLEHRRRQGPPTVAAAAAQVHGQSVAGKINGKIGLRITVIVGTMWCAYVFAAIALVSFKDNLGSTQDLILWVSSSFLQLVLLPIIIVGQNIQARASDKRADDTYRDAEAIMHETLQLQEHLQAQDELLSEMINHARTLIAAIPQAPGA
jgi:hypothetical protein